MRSVLILVAALLAILLLLLLARGRAARRRWIAATAGDFEHLLARQAGWRVEREALGWRVHRDSRELGTLSLAEVLDAAERADRRGPDRRTDAWAARLRFLDVPLVPLVGPLSLKLHGPHLLPRPSHPELVAALPRHAAPALGRSADLECPLLYVIGETGPPTYVTEEAVRAAGLDIAALHGVATAVLRQRLDPVVVERALAGALVEVRPTDGCGAARLALLPELLSGGQRIAAVVLDPATLLLAPRAAAGRLDERLAAARSEPREALLDRVLEVDADGVRRAER